MTTYVTMYDATHANVAHIPADAQKVAGYITGSTAIQWTPEDWARFPHAGHVQIDQGFGNATSQHDVHVLKVIDSEPGAFSAAAAAQLVYERVKAGIVYTTIYCDRNDAPKMVPALKAATPPGASQHWYIGHVHLWLAAPGLTDAEARAIVGTEYHGLLCRAVQNQNAGAYDVSVTAADWYPAPAQAKPVLVSVEVTARYSDGSTKRSVV